MQRHAAGVPGGIRAAHCCSLSRRGIAPYSATGSGARPFESIKTKKYPIPNGIEYFFGVPGGIRTRDLLIRSQTLYPAELRAHKKPNCLYYYKEV